MPSSTSEAQESCQSTFRRNVPQYEFDPPLSYGNYGDAFSAATENFYVPTSSPRKKSTKMTYSETEDDYEGSKNGSRYHGHVSMSHHSKRHNSSRQESEESTTKGTLGSALCLLGLESLLLFIHTVHRFLGCDAETPEK